MRVPWAGTVEGKREEQEGGMPAQARQLTQKTTHRMCFSMNHNQKVIQSSLKPLCMVLGWQETCPSA